MLNAGLRFIEFSMLLSPPPPQALLGDGYRYSGARYTVIYDVTKFKQVVVTSVNSAWTPQSFTQIDAPVGGGLRAEPSAARGHWGLGRIP